MLTPAKNFAVKTKTAPNYQSPKANIQNGKRLTFKPRQSANLRKLLLAGPASLEIYLF